MSISQKEGDILVLERRFYSNRGSRVLKGEGVSPLPLKKEV